jgi:pyochelin biosynthetic protein PchC
VQYPGREDRLRERPIDDMDALANSAAHVIDALRRSAVVLYGHSMGAAVAYEVATRVSCTASALVVSGHGPPVFDDARPLRQWDDDAIVADLLRLGGPSSAAALQNAALRTLVLPALRADYRLAEHYRPTWKPPLACPIVAMRGDGDAEVSAEEISAWRELTAAAFHSVEMAGDHFFPVRDPSATVASITEALRHVMTGGLPRSVETSAWE